MAQCCGNNTNNTTNEYGYALILSNNPSISSVFTLNIAVKSEVENCGSSKSFSDGIEDRIVEFSITVF